MGKKLTTCWELNAKSIIFYNISNDYRYDADVAQEYDNVFPSAHAHIALRQFPFKYMDYLVFVLNQLHLVGYENKEGC
jgi:hypothetical protein